MTENFDDKIVKALEELFRSLDCLMQLGSASEDKELRRLIGRLAAEMSAQIDFDIYPYLKRTPTCDADSQS